MSSANQHRLYFLLQLAAGRLKKQADKQLLDKAGISTAQSAVLMLLREHGALSQRELAQQLAQQESAITTMVARLRAGGLVSKQRSRADGRAWQINITAQGRQALRRSASAFAAINGRLDACLDAEQAADLARHLSQVIEEFE